MMTGAKQAHELASLLVTEAVRTTLARVAADYPLDYTSLLRAYEAEVVEHCCAMVDHNESDAVQMCSAKTTRGKPCGQRAVINGVCTKHLGVWKRQQETQRRQEAYVACVQREAPNDRYAQELKDRGQKRQVSMAFPSDVGSVLCDLSKRRAV